MMIIEETYVPEEALPIEAFKRHLRLGSGFAQDDLQDSVLVAFLRAAMAAIETRSGKALIARRFLMTEARVRGAVIALPVGPVSDVESVTVIDRFGSGRSLDAAGWRLRSDLHRPEVVFSASAPVVPEGGSLELRFTAGFGAHFSDLPDDLRQAVLMLAAHYYAYREDTGLGQGCMPFGVTSLIARYRPLRMGFTQ